MIIGSDRERLVCLAQSYLDQPTQVGGASVGANQWRATHGIETCRLAIAFKALGTCVQADSQSTCASHDHSGFSRAHESYGDV
ncbi:hypothetical protein D3C75_1259530 [compost metagenome]